MKILNIFKNQNQIYKFNKAVNCIFDDNSERFCIVNWLLVPLKKFLIFGVEKKYLLDFFDGTTKERLYRKLKSKEKVDRLLGDFWNMGYTKQIATERIPVKKQRLIKNKKQTRSVINKYRAKYYQNNEKVPWSGFRPPFSLPKASFDFATTNICNLACEYCFVNSNIERESRVMSSDYMSKELIVLSVEKMLDYIKTKYSFGLLNVNFFGGMVTAKGKCRDLLYFTTEQLNKRAFEEGIFLSLGIVDNGVTIDDELAKFFKYYNFKITISYDLPKDIHDRQRPFKNGEKSSDKVENSLKILSKYKLKPGIRATLTKNNQHRIVESLDYIKRFNVSSILFFPVSVPSSHSKSSGVFKPDPECLYEEYKKAYKYVVELYNRENEKLTFSPLSQIIRLIVNGGSLQFCGMGRDFYSLNSNGDIHACHRVKVNDFYLGNIQDNDVVDKLICLGDDDKRLSHSLRGYFDDSNYHCIKDCSCSDAFGQYRCSTCEIFGFCLGGCKAAAYSDYDCRMVGFNFFDDYRENCKYTKKFIKDIFWDYIDSKKNKNNQYYNYFKLFMPKHS